MGGRGRQRNIVNCRRPRSFAGHESIIGDAAGLVKQTNKHRMTQTSDRQVVRQKRRQTVRRTDSDTERQTSNLVMRQ